MSDFIVSEHFLDNYIWIIVFVVIIIIIIFVPNLRRVEPIHSLPNYVETSVWKSESDPKWFIHLTDIHIDSFHTSINEHFEKSLQFSEKFHSHTLVLTGDLVNGWGNSSFFKTGDQRINDWELYSQITNKYYGKFKHVFDQVGNHDQWNIWSINSQNFNYSKYSYHFHRTYSNEEEFWAIPEETEDYFFLFINPFHFPTPRAKFDVWARDTPEMLTIIEQAINQIKEARQANPKPFFIFCHCPLCFWEGKNKSFYGHTISEILSDSGCNSFITGHAHIPEPHFSHYNGVLEVIGVNVLSDSGYNLVTIDNNRVAYHSWDEKHVDYQNPQKFVLTHPVPKQQMNNSFCFSENNTAVRVLAFNIASNSVKLHVKISDFSNVLIVDSDLSFSRNITPPNQNQDSIGNDDKNDNNPSVNSLGENILNFNL